MHAVKKAGRFDTIILGGGPAGLFCAIRCSLPGRRTLILEKMDSCGKKLSLTGSGQCNLTHSGEINDFFAHYGPHGKFLKPALFALTNRDLCGYFESRGIRLEAGDDGKVFPASRSSRDILGALLRHCTENGVEIRCGETVTSVTRTENLFTVATRSSVLSADYLVIATGGASYPGTGSTGDGYRLAASLGHTIVPPAPALTPVAILDFPFSDLAGISFPDMSFSIWRTGKKVIESHGDVLITHSGLSGPGILDTSRWISAGDHIRLSFIGKVPYDQCAGHLLNSVQTQGSRTVSSLLAPYAIPGRVLVRLLEIAGIGPGQSGAHLTAGQRRQLAASLTGLPLAIAGLGDFSMAMVTRGGVALPELNGRTMESRRTKNLFFAGEVMDIDGDSGGYNLQAAFSTGWLAGSSIRNHR